MSAKPDTEQYTSIDMQPRMVILSDWTTFQPVGETLYEIYDAGR